MTTPARSGVFQHATDRRVETFTESIHFDYRLGEQDIAGSLAHARMLCKVGLLTADELDQLEVALREVQQELASGALVWKAELEDVHMHIEQAVIDRLGDVGRKLHTARSRNDQVSTDLRLWCRQAIDRLDLLLKELQRAFVHRCGVDTDVILPAYTHLQRAQPVLAAHYWLAYCEKLQRDRERLKDCRKRVNISPLGAAAVAGTSLPIDRHFVAQQLGFDGVANNSLDVSSDRDFVLELAFATAMIAEHLSGWAEEWILWSTAEFGMLRLPQAFCTGSSIMPQKVNPDVLELIRGKSARVVGGLQSLLVLIKGLPLAYNRDLQEDKLPLFECVDTVEACLTLAQPIVAQSQLLTDSISRRLDEGYLDATSLMEHMIQRGIPQRTAHHLAGTLVRRAMDRQVPLRSLSVEEFRQADSRLDESVYGVLGARRAVEAYRSFGSSQPQQVAEQVERWKSILHLPESCEP